MSPGDNLSLLTSVSVQERQKSMAGNAQEFSLSAALSEIDYQERLLCALTREMERLRRAPGSAPRSETALEARHACGATEASNAPLVIGEPQQAWLEEEISCE